VLVASRVRFSSTFSTSHPSLFSLSSRQHERGSRERKEVKSAPPALKKKKQSFNYVKQPYQEKKRAVCSCRQLPCGLECTTTYTHPRLPSHTYIYVFFFFFGVDVGTCARENNNSNNALLTFFCDVDNISNTPVRGEQNYHRGASVRNLLFRVRLDCLLMLVLGVEDAILIEKEEECKQRSVCVCLCVFVCIEGSRRLFVCSYADFVFKKEKKENSKYFQRLLLKQDWWGGGGERAEESTDAASLFFLFKVT
jgi:hypothetical protein